MADKVTLTDAEVEFDLQIEALMSTITKMVGDKEASFEHNALRSVRSRVIPDYYTEPKHTLFKLSRERGRYTPLHS